MKESGASTGWAMCAIAGLLALGPATSLLPRPRSDLTRWSHGFSRVLHREVNLDPLSPSDNYYERLIDDSQEIPESRLVSAVAGMTLGARGLERKILRERSDYLATGFKSNVRIQTPEGLFVTNSLGLADVDHPTTKAPGTRRIVLLGDSISRGWGVGMDKTYRSLLQNRLNTPTSPAGASRFEILNFALDGYVTTQFPPMAEEARGFAPDLYLLGLTSLDGGTYFSEHVAGLISSGRDLRYPQLRELVRRSGASAADSEEAIEAKLAPYWKQITTWAFREVRTAASPAPVMAILLPSLDDSPASREWPVQMRLLLADLKIRFIDISDCFSGTVDLDELRVEGDRQHPNARGHQLIFDCLYNRWTSDPALWAILPGQ